MHFLASLIMVVGVVFAVCLSLVKLTWDLTQVSIHEPPEVPDMTRGAARAYGSRQRELSETP